MQGEICKITTPKRFLLDAVFFGSRKPKNLFIFLHGLSGNLFRHTDLFKKIVDKDNAVLAFNNRGSGVVIRVKQLCTRLKIGYKSSSIGMAHEVFTDCIDDIEGAIKCARTFRPKNIFLVGHSTGCQKSIYYLAKRPKSPVKGAILLAPMSDYADAIAFSDRKTYARALKVALKMVKEGRAHELMPKNIWEYTLDAQRFLSLYTPESIEEIFTYASGKNPKILRQVGKPLLNVLAEKDEFCDRPIIEIADWFGKNMVGKKCEIKIIKDSFHNFSGRESLINRFIKQWIAKI